MKIAISTSLALLVFSGMAHASKKCEGEVDITRSSANGRKIEYTVSIRHDAPTDLANVGWSYRFDYTGIDGTSHTVYGNAGHSTSKRRDRMSSYTAANSPNPPVQSLGDASITDVTCWYN
jgi:hypothetical protein